MVGAMALALQCCSAEEGRAEISVANGWTRQIAHGQRTGAVYLTIANRGDGGDRLVSVEAAQGEAALHSSSSAGGVARMRPLENGLEIGARSTMKLMPGGTHIMLAGIKQPAIPGETFGLTLGFERSGKRRVSIRVVRADGDGLGHGM
jgi:copper(I)-binding protein